MRERTSAGVALGLVWAVVLLLTVYGAATVRDEIAGSDVSRWPWLRHGATSLVTLGETMGLTRVRDALERLRAVVNRPYLVLERKRGGLSAAAAGAGPAAAPGDGPSHRASPRKRRVLVVGASSIQFALGVELERRLATYDGVTVTRLGKLATGLSRPDLFDWPAQVDALARRFEPDLVIANFGGNCALPIPVGGDREVEFGTDEWDRLYIERVQAFVAVVRRHGADLVFAGMPNMRDPARAEKMARLNHVQRRAAEAAGAVWLSTWEMTSTTDGRYRALVEYQGERGLMRTIDGVHFRTLGARYIVDEFMQVVERHFVLIPPEPALARAERHMFQSRRLGRSVSYVAFVPRALGGRHGRPVLYVLPGADSRWDEWPNYPHRALQRAAQEQDLVLVVPEGEVESALVVADLVRDVETHLPVSGRRGLVGPDLAGLHAALARLDVPHTFQEVDGAAFRRSLRDQVAWHAARLQGRLPRPEAPAAGAPGG